MLVDASESHVRLYSLRSWQSNLCSSYCAWAALDKYGGYVEWGALKFILACTRLVKLSSCVIGCLLYGALQSSANYDYPRKRFSIDFRWDIPIKFDITPLLRRDSVLTRLPCFIIISIKRQDTVRVNGQRIKLSGFTTDLEGWSRPKAGQERCGLISLFCILCVTRCSVIPLPLLQSHPMATFGE